MTRGLRKRFGPKSKAGAAEPRECSPFLYKYRDLRGGGLEFLQKTLLEDEIYLAGPADFNDPFDSLPNFDLTGSVESRAKLYERVLARHEPTKTDAERAALAFHLAQNPVMDLGSDEARLQMQHLFNEVRSQLGVYCVCECADSLLMWSHYGGSHAGVCLEFDSSQWPFSTAQEVLYASEREPVRRAHESDERSMEKGLLTKFEGWRYEQEWRVVDFERGPGVHRIPEATLTGIVLGARIDPVHETKILEWVAQRRQRIRVLRAVASDSAFQVDIRPIGYPH